MSTEPIRVALLGYDGVQTLDLDGPLDAFESANAVRPGAYETVTAGVDGRPFTIEAGLRVTPDCALADAGPIDTLIVPGGEGARRSATSPALAAAIKARAATVRRVVSVCTGIYAVAAAGLLERSAATTHWRFAADFAGRFPTIALDVDAIFIKDGPYYTLRRDHRGDRPGARADRGGLRSAAVAGRGSGSRGVREAGRRPAAVFRAPAVPGARVGSLCRARRVAAGAPAREPVGRAVGRTCAPQPAAVQSGILPRARHDAGTANRSAAPRCRTGLPDEQRGERERDRAFRRISQRRCLQARVRPALRPVAHRFPPALLAGPAFIPRTRSCAFFSLSPWCWGSFS